jgi:hypothetical protein
MSDGLVLMHDAHYRLIVSLLNREWRRLGSAFRSAKACSHLRAFARSTTRCSQAASRAAPGAAMPQAGHAAERCAVAAGVQAVHIILFVLLWVIFGTFVLGMLQPLVRQISKEVRAPMHPRIQGVFCSRIPI